MLRQFLDNPHSFSRLHVCLTYSITIEFTVRQALFNQSDTRIKRLNRMCRFDTSGQNDTVMRNVFHMKSRYSPGINIACLAKGKENTFPAMLL